MSSPKQNYYIIINFKSKNISLSDKTYYVFATESYDIYKNVILCVIFSDPATLNIFATRPNPKKKRKSRTAFTNHQIFELEKRFLYQKYLSPADRDEIAAGLGLSNAQVSLKNLKLTLKY